MSLKHVFAVVTLLSTSAFAEEDLKPAQEEAKAKLEEEIEDDLKATNDKCGTKLEVKTDFQNFKTDDWSGTSFSSYCEAVIQEIGSMCENRPAYKKVIAKKVTGVACLFGGVKPVEKKDGSNDATLRNMSLDKGVFTYHMSSKGHANLGDNTKATLEKAFN
ncbi:hypothetical protein D7Y27_07890 [Corallococcus sp. AB004]|uniref:Uncharacterized protein n=1 Tax=Corallococcus exiguus TaxID=83462 RepID=A0A7X4YH97_9BACT|nr:hypothetical protein [Corallococcus exiguus]RKI46629.1 hypothetical protein D7Y27_07890 [Corallococcus sp. AB004]NBC45381.1 hypothetical protein [Corallococcus exiguus]NPC72395.1 hypothetical protein [Corallococcus exiguus]NPD22084.1 hypothetical protein [Corallococcus exiguus]TNV57027.1 hypothetical protein FH620_29480 [Corallococcus exiguus]